MSGIEQSAGNIAAGRQSPASHVVTIAFSAGGLRPLRSILRELPNDFAAAVVVVHHVLKETELPAILRTSSTMRVQFANGHELLAARTVYVCPPDHHVFIRPDRSVGLSTAPRVRFARPSADWLFESAASVFGRCSAAVVLSGRLSDGARGVTWAKRWNGCTIAQRPESCAYQSMPATAIRTGCIDLVLDPEAIGPALCQFVRDDDYASVIREWDAPFETIGE